MPNIESLGCMENLQHCHLPSTVAVTSQVQDPLLADKKMNSIRAHAKNASLSRYVYAYFLRNLRVIACFATAD